MTVDKEAILEQISATVGLYSVKKMAMELDKPYSTLSNELRHVEYAKLGFTTALAILEKALAPDADNLSRESARKVIEMICTAFGYVAFRIPEAGQGEMTSFSRIRLSSLLDAELRTTDVRT